jgi:hypothetical protein
MSEDFKPTPPEYNGDGVSIWKSKDKNGKTFLKVKCKWIKDTTFNVFKKETKEDGL